MGVELCPGNWCATQLAALGRWVEGVEAGGLGGFRDVAKLTRTLLDLRRVWVNPNVQHLLSYRGSS